MPAEDRSQFPNVRNQLAWQPLKCLVYLISVVNDLQTRANHLHQVEQEEGHGVNLQQRHMEGEPALSVTLRDNAAVWIRQVKRESMWKMPVYVSYFVEIKYLERGVVLETGGSENIVNCDREARLWAGGWSWLDGPPWGGKRQRGICRKLD